MKRIYKYPLYNFSPTDIPNSYKILSYGVQNGMVYFWAEIGANPESMDYPIKLDFKIVATGDEVPEERYVYQATVFDGPFVWHIYLWDW